MEQSPVGDEGKIRAIGGGSLYCLILSTEWGRDHVLGLVSRGYRGGGAGEQVVAREWVRVLWRNI